MLRVLGEVFAKMVASLRDRQLPNAKPIVYAPLTVDDEGWLVGDNVVRAPIDLSWCYPTLGTPSGDPLAIVAHYSATNPGTAMNMARRRANRFRRKMAGMTEKDAGVLYDRAASWHVSVESGGTIVQMAPFIVGCWHAASDTAKPIAGAGYANRVSVGVELIGHGKLFPEEQVVAACRLWRAIAQRYAIKRGHAMVPHSLIDPARRSDPGPVWMREHAERVLAYAFSEALA